VGYVTHGKRQTKFVALDAGILLCAYPYFVDGGCGCRSPVWSCSPLHLSSLSEPPWRRLRAAARADRIAITLNPP
jgi:hypothetical protein